MRLVQVKVPARSVEEEVLSREEIKQVLDDLRRKVLPLLCPVVEHRA